MICRLLDKVNYLVSASIEMKEFLKCVEIIDDRDVTKVR